MPQFIRPIPGGRIGRVDQGVDISASPGTPILAIARSKVIGSIPNWYAGQPYYWFQIVGTNRYWYAAEQIDFHVHPGEIVNAGQQIGTYAASGTATEFGWATASGSTLARATTGYVRGTPTPAGTDFMNSVIKGGRSTIGVGPSTAAASRPPDTGGKLLSQFFQNYVDLRDTPRSQGNPRSFFSDFFTIYVKNKTPTIHV